MKLLALILLAPLVAFAGDKEFCAAQDPSVDRAACMKEQRNARAEKNLDVPADLVKNRLARCQVFKDDADRLSCYDRVKKGTTEGKVSSGGTITTYKEVIVGK